jgi:enamine deaminase RidA (YjgF/YER057c/UK114 family)
MNLSIIRNQVGPRMSASAICNNIVYLGGQVPLDTAHADIATQTQEVLDRVDRLLLEAGSDKSHILQCQIFLVDISDIGAMNLVWDAWISAGHAPPRATVQTALADPRWRIEVLVTAAIADNAPF